jgi:hypothetical protein
MVKSSMPRSRSGRLLAWISIAVSVAIVAVAERDLHARPDAEVRGDKRLWRLVCLNALGALAYFRWGRRPS